MLLCSCGQRAEAIGDEVSPMVRTARQIIDDVRTSSAELAARLVALESNNEGNSDLAWRIRDYIRAVEALVLAISDSDRAI